jgi:hypothetical protein
MIASATSCARVDEHEKKFAAARPYVERWAAGCVSCGVRTLEDGRRYYAPNRSDDAVLRAASDLARLFSV